MTRKTLDQIRVEVALKAKMNITRGNEGGDKIKNFPIMIQNNGLLGALAYAVERKTRYDKKTKKSVDLGPKNESEQDMANFICKYLNKISEHDYTVTGNKNLQKPEDLIGFLVECTPEQFRRIHAEVMAFMNYFRRFAS